MIGYTPAEQRIRAAHGDPPATGMDEHARRWVSYRTIRCADGSHGAMPFARCSCGWEGPGRLDTDAALTDLTAHGDTTTGPEVTA